MRRQEANALAGRQFGVLARRQALALGLSKSAIARCVASGEWAVIFRGVYRLGVFPRSQRQRVMGACLFFVGTGVASHRSAGRLWQLDAVDSPRPEMTVVRAGRAALPGVTIHRSLELPAVDRRTVEGIPVTSPERTLVDLAAVLDERALELALEDALRRGLTTARRVAERMQSLGGSGRRGSGVLRDLLEIRHASPAESALEVDVERFLRQRGLAHFFVRQYEVWDGQRRRRLDWAAPDAMVALEAESWRHHGGRRAWSADRARNARLEALGWLFVGITAHDVDAEPDLLDARIRRAFERAASLPFPA